MYLIWIFGSKSIRSNNQSSATLCVLETCLIVGLLPLIIILITASLSSNTYNKASWLAKIGRLREHNQCYSTRWSFLEIVCLILIFVPLTTGRTELSDLKSWNFQGQKQSDPTNREQESRPISIQRPKRWFQILLNCVKLNFCFLHIQLIGTNVWLPKMHNVHPEVDFESSRSPAKSESWNSPNLHCFAVFPTWQYCLYSHVWWM